MRKQKRIFADEETKQKAVAMMAEGKSATETAAELKLNPRTVQTWRARAGLTGATPKPPKPKKARTGGRGVIVSDEVKAQALAAMDGGKNPTEVSREMGLPRSTVDHWRKTAWRKADPQEAPLQPVQELAQVEAPQAPAETLRPSASHIPAIRETEGGSVLYIRITPDLRAIGAPERIKALAEDGGFPEAAVARNLLILGLAAVARAPGLLARAPAELRRALAQGEV